MKVTRFQEAVPEIFWPRSERETINEDPRPLSMERFGDLQSDDFDSEGGGHHEAEHYSSGRRTEGVESVITRRERNVCNVMKFSAINVRENCSILLTPRHRDGDSRNYFQGPGSSF